MVLNRLDIGTGCDQGPESWLFRDRYGPVFDGISIDVKCSKSLDVLGF